MKTHALILSFVLLAGAAAPVFAEEAKTPAGMDPAQMEKMKQMMAPDENHKKLETFVGTWDYTAKFWMAPGAPPETMTGKSVNEMIYGGRFLKQTIQGQWMGEAWEGLGYTGYDKMRKQYQGVWVDSMATSLMWSEGSFDDATKTLQMAGTASCPMTGETHQQMRSEAKAVDSDHHTYNSYTNGPDGKEFKGMEIEFVRSK